jgi:hypothetical protein
MLRPQSDYSIGALDAEGLHVIAKAGATYLPMTPPPTVLDMWELARRLDLRQIWLTTDAVLALGLPVELDRRNPGAHPFLDSGALRHPDRQTVLSPWLTHWSADGEHRLLEISVPGWDRGSPFHSCAGFAPGLAGEVGEFVERSGMLWRRNGQTTSDAWLREHVRDLRSTEAPPPGDDGNLEADLRTVRELTDAERRLRFVHAYDANAMYLGAASSLSLPVGQAKYYPADLAPGPQIKANFGPGYWRCGDVWVTTPTAAYSNTHPIVECWKWPEHHRFLEKWYRVLRDARKALVPFGPSPALDAVKATYRQGIGQLASHRKDRSDPLYQPYWRHAIQAEARTRLERRIATLLVSPFAVDVDCIYVLGNLPDAEITARRIGVPLGDGIGEFKVKGTARASIVRSILKSSREAEVLAALRKEVVA